MHTQNAVAYMLQVGAIAALAELLPRIVPVASAGFRYAYWRVVLAAALMAPWLLRATPPATVPASAVSPVLATVATVVDSPLSTVQSSGVGVDWPSLLPWVLAAGVLARMLWVSMGLVRLRALARRAVSLADPVYDEIQQALGTRAQVKAVRGLAQPATFGVRRPVVLVPADLAPSDSLRRAVVTHELVHVLRRDWVWVLGEEALRAALWFHPAVWWLTARIRQAREEFTDHLTVLATGDRRAYVEALLAFAEDGALDPAPAFARRGHLFHRVGSSDWYDVDFRDEDGRLHANYDTIVLRYVSTDGETSTNWTDSFDRALLAYLEFEEAKRNPQMAGAKLQARALAWQDAYKSAKLKNDMTERPRFNDVGLLVRARGGTGSGRFARTREQGTVWF